MSPGTDRQIRSIPKLPSLVGRSHIPLDKFVGALALEQFIVFYCDRNAMFHILNFVRLHRAAEPLDQNPAPLAELMGTGFREP